MVITVHSLSLGTHTGTHIDAPFHFFPSGKKLHRDRARADLAGTSAVSLVGPRSEGKADVVLFWTGWEVHWGTPKYFAHPYFSRGVARKLRELGASIVGVDVLSPDETPTRDGWGVHEGVVGQRGAHTRGGEEIWVSLMPLSIHDADGAPVRAYGWKQYPAV
ncbi:hypothetical protein BU15DRAFT_89490 [Melanogaster broomeanus]|nr:hypothetical protein BU15DRAFT_89490 [Melanogaster broomeanus]